MSVYQLINRLCVELLNECDQGDVSIQTARRIAFEILLKKSFDEKIVDPEKIIEDYNFITFELTLLNKSKEIENVEKFINVLKENQSLTFVGVSSLLVNLKNIDPTPDGAHKKHEFLQLQTSALNDIAKNKYFSQAPFAAQKTQLLREKSQSNKIKSNRSSRSEDESSNFFSSILELSIGQTNDNQRDKLKLKPIQPVPSKSSRSLAIVEKVNSGRRESSEEKSLQPSTWENICYRNEISQRSFTSESISSFISQRLSSFSKHKAHTEIVTIPFPKLLNDIKLLLIGIESESFKRANDTLIFYPTAQISCGDVSDLNCVLETFLETGTCFKRLKVYSGKNPFNQNQIFNGFVFEALCDRIIKFLNYCRDIVYSQEADTLLELNKNTRKIQRIIIHLSKFLNIHPSIGTRQNCIPNGSEILRQLYNEYTNALDNDIKCFIVELLKACCEVYYLRYQEWLYHGKIVDPHEELFIYFVDHYNLNTKYYFDRAYLIRKQSVPAFLNGCTDEVLLCGKYTLLLKSYNPMHPLFMITKPQFKICLTFKEITELKKSCEEFSKKARMVCGETISIGAILEEKEKNDVEKYKKAEQASVKNMLKWKQQQEARTQEIRIYREHQQKELRKELEMIEERKMLKRLEAIQAEREYMDELEDIERHDLEKENVQLRERIKIYQRLNEQFEVTKEKSEIKPETAKLKKSLNYSSTQEDIINANSLSNEDAKNHDGVTMDELNNVIIEKATTLTQAQNNKFKVMSHEYNFLTGHQSDNNRNAESNSSKTTITTLTDAQKNKRKVMGHEYNLFEDEEKTEPKISVQDYDKMSDLQRNRLKVMSHEFEQIDIQEEKVKPMKETKSHAQMTDLQRNRQKVLSHEFGYDDEIRLKQQQNSAKQREEEAAKKESLMRSEKLSLDLLKPDSMDKQTLESPMSVTSDNFNSDSNEFLEKANDDNFDDDDDDDEMLRAFEEAIEKNRENFLGIASNDSNEQSSLLSNYEKIMTIDSMALSKFLQKSLMLPLNAYMEVLNNETLKMYIQDLGILSHFKSLRNYFLLMNGEYCSSICHEMFSKIQCGAKPVELLNYQSLHMILDHALNNSRNDPNSENLSFIVQNLPGKFELYSPGILSMLSLSYKIEWPLSLILNPETMDRYRAIFNYLIKLKRISWILEECFQILKDSRQEHGSELLKSQQYRTTQHIRHKMMHFVSCLENYITRNVLQISWNAFMQDLKSAETILCIYRKHTNYLKRILFLCLLSKRSNEFYKSIEDLFKVILKFHKHLKSYSWRKEDSKFIHEKYDKITTDADDFDRLIRYVMYLGNKIVQHGNQKEIYDLLQLIDINGYYSDSIN